MTIQEIANITGLSIATVHRALNQPQAVSEKVLRQVQQVINEIDSHPNYLKQVYVILPHMNTFYSQFLVELINMLIKYDIQTIPFISNDSPEKEEEFLKTISFSSRTGLVWSPVDEDADYPFLNRKKNRPVIVFINHELNNHKADVSIIRANDEACRIAIDTMIHEGAKNLLFLSGFSRTARARTKFFYKHIKQYTNVQYEVVSADFDNWQNSYNILCEQQELFQKCDAIISANEMLSYATLKLLKKMNLQIPNDVQFLGFDNVPIFDALSLSTVHFSPIHMAKKTSELLITKTQQSQYSQQYHFMPQLHLLGSEKKQNK